MSEPRLYLYRKAGRVVWDAEMWLPGGARKVWRTGLADKEAARTAALARLKVLAEPAPPPVEVAATSTPTTVVVETPVAVVADDVGKVPASVGSFVDRFEKWFFADLAQLRGLLKTASTDG